MSKPGAKELQLRDLRARPPHHQMMIADGAPEACLRTGPGPKIKPKDERSAGVTLAPPLAIQKAIKADLAEPPTTPDSPEAD